MSDTVLDQLWSHFDTIKPLFKDWTPANWIAFGTASVSLALGLANLKSTAKRERLKNRREEFHRRVATPIENALDQFTSLADELHDHVIAARTIEPPILEGFQTKATAAQRKLSRALRYAADSRLCGSEGWDVGTFEYDCVLEALEAVRSAAVGEQCNRLRVAAQAIEKHDNLVREKIREELHRYT